MCICNYTEKHIIQLLQSGGSTQPIACCAIILDLWGASTEMRGFPKIRGANVGSQKQARMGLPWGPPILGDKLAN